MKKLKIKVAFAGFRHSHAEMIYAAVKSSDQAEIVACWEQNKQTINKLHNEFSIRITHDNYEKMLSEVDCDVIAIADCYNNRGKIAISALEKGKHIISDKPLCTTHDELNKIEKLCLEKKLSVGCLFNLRDFGVFRTLKQIISDNISGQIESIILLGLHPLNINSRPVWYLDKRYYCGVLNDIGPHAFDLIEWVTGVRITDVTFARTWNGKAKNHPDFEDCGQFTAVCDCGTGILCDLSYLAPEKLAYAIPQMWRITCYGQKGMAETGLSWDTVKVATDADAEVRTIHPQANNPNSYLDDFIQEICGTENPTKLSSSEVLRATKHSIISQNLAANLVHNQ